MQERSLVLFTAFTAAAFALLIGLGVWQLQRLEWKQSVIAQIEARTKAEPVSLAEAMTRARSGEDVSYLRVRAEGRFDHGKERYLYAFSDGNPGWHVITPLTTANGDIVLIDRGFVPDERKNPASRPQGQLGGPVALTGLARPPEAQWLFVPDNEPGQNSWFWRDLGAMAGSMDLGDGAQVAPFFVEAERSDIPGGWPLGGQTRLDIPNDHLQYALTWFLLAFCLAVIYVIYVRSRWRQASTRPVAGEGSGG